MVFHWSDSMSPQVSRTFLSILAILNNAMVWMVSICPPTSKPSSAFNSRLVTIPNSTITISLISTFMFLPFTFFQFYSVISIAKSTILQVLFFYCWLLSGLIFWPRFGDPFVCQSAIGVCVCPYPGQLLSCAYTICSYGQISISCTSQWITLLTQSTWNSPRLQYKTIVSLTRYAYCYTLYPRNNILNMSIGCLWAS